MVADKTGYPEDMLELDLDLEADLGIDTVKQAETFAAIRESSPSRSRKANLRDYPTLSSVIELRAHACGPTWPLPRRSARRPQCPRVGDTAHAARQLP